MTHTTVDIFLDDPAPSPRRARDGAWSRWWRTLPAAVRAPVLPGTLAALVIVGLLLAFHQVVRESVRQGELLRTAAASRAEAVWRCNTLARAAMRANCLARVDSPPPARPDAAPPPNTASLATAGLGQ